MSDAQSREDMAQAGRKAVAQTQHILTQVGQSTETAWGELFEALNALLADEHVPQTTKDVLNRMMNALQFQDVVSQQLAAAQTVLNNFDAHLAPFADAPDVVDVDAEGAFDASASFDRERVDTDDLDAWINQAKEDDT